MVYREEDRKRGGMRWKTMREKGAEDRQRE